MKVIDHILAKYWLPSGVPQNYLSALEQADQKLLDIVSEPRYMAALKRIISVMPDNAEQKRYLIEKIINSGR